MEERAPKKLWEYEVRCPICGSSMLISEYIYSIPIYGNTLIITGECGNCGFRARHVIHLDLKEPRRVILRVSSPEDIRALVVRGPSARIIIPEFEISVEPGGASQGYITTVEGVVEDIMNLTRIACESESSPKCPELLEKLALAKEGLIEYTLILEDPDGFSDIASNKTKYEALKLDEAAEGATPQ